MIAFWITFGLIVGFAAFVAAARKDSFAAFMGSAQFHSFILVVCILYLFLFYITLAVTTKRLHDRNKTAWWLLVFVALPIILNIPRDLEMVYVFNHFNSFIKAAQHGEQFRQSPAAIVGSAAAALISLWAFVELFFLRGTMGDNRYGPDPLAGRS